MKRIAKFEKVSFGQFASDWKGADEGLLRELYDGIKLPRRATKGSAGYDFYAPRDFSLAPGETIKIPTGVRAKIDDGWVLKIYPRSGLGFKFRLQLDNTVGIIDSDYYNSSNEGHIMIKITNNSLEGKTVQLEKGNAFAQGLFLEYGITVDDDADGIRDGGFGSTTK
ncbi:MAG: deoxyuridine 5'-triphosphate nucleotidohydrolase [Clostridia bacterium]|nr:deoxyuridine 5'-triphosphate nucleotidohydrolase [Clostridia bacterium]